MCAQLHTHTHMQTGSETQRSDKKKSSLYYKCWWTPCTRYRCSAGTIKCLLTGKKEGWAEKWLIPPQRGSALPAFRLADSWSVIHHLNTLCFNPSWAQVSVCDQWLAPVLLPLLKAWSCAAKPTSTSVTHASCWIGRALGVHWHTFLDWLFKCRMPFYFTFILKTVYRVVHISFLSVQWRGDETEFKQNKITQSYLLIAVSFRAHLKRFLSLPAPWYQFYVSINIHTNTQSNFEYPSHQSVRYLYKLTFIQILS